MADDYIPQPDDAFVHWADNFLVYAGDNSGAVGMVPADITVLSAVINPVDAAWTALKAAEVAFKSARSAFDDARKPAEALLRVKSQIVQANPNVADPDRVGLGLNVRSSHRTPAGPIDTWPVLYRVDQEPLRHRLWFSDSATPGSKAKPKGAAFCEIREQIVAAGGAAPTDRDAMPFLCTETKSPHRNDFDDAEKGHTAYYTQRWVTTRNEPGPWGPITAYPVL